MSVKAKTAKKATVTPVKPAEVVHDAPKVGRWGLPKTAKGNICIVKGSREWKAWFDGFVEMSVRRGSAKSLADLVEKAIVEKAFRDGYTETPPIR